MVLSSLFIFAAYLMGSIPVGLLVARMKGVDLRKVGSGNIGATNVGRALGKKWAIFTFICDAMKGYLPVILFVPWSPHGSAETQVPFALGCGIAAIAGHNWPVFLRFKGGKGVATSAGVLLGVAPLAAAIGLATWFIVFTTSRYVSLASIAVAFVIPTAAWMLYIDSGVALPATLTMLGALIVLRHRENIKRLLAGTESKFERKKKTTANESASAEKLRRDKHE